MASNICPLGKTFCNSSRVCRAALLISQCPQERRRVFKISGKYKSVLSRNHSACHLVSLYALINTFKENVWTPYSHRTARMRSHTPPATETARLFQVASEHVTKSALTENGGSSRRRRCRCPNAHCGMIEPIAYRAIPDWFCEHII